MLKDGYVIGAMKAWGQGPIIDITPRSGLVGIAAAVVQAVSRAAMHDHARAATFQCGRQGTGDPP